MPLSTDSYRSASELMESTGAFKAHPTNKIVLNLDMNRALNSRQLIQLMATSLHDDMVECQEDTGVVNKIVCLGWLSTVVAATAVSMDVGKQVIGDAAIIGYDMAEGQFLGKIELDERVLIVSDVLYGRDLDSQIKLIRAIGARGAAVVGIAACLDMEQNVLQCLADHTTNDFMVGVGATGGDNVVENVVEGMSKAMANAIDDDDIGDTGILGIDILNLSTVVSHLVSAGKLDSYMVQRIDYFLSTEYNEWLARRDAEVRARNSRFFYQHDPTSWHYTGFMDTWNPNLSPISPKVIEHIDFLIKKEQKRTAKARKSQEDNDDEKPVENVEEDAGNEDPPLDSKDVPVPKLYINPVIMDLSNVRNWGIIKHRIKTAMDTPVDGSMRVVEGTNDDNRMEPKYEPCGNLSCVVLNYNAIDGWDKAKALELYKLRKEAGFAIVVHGHNIYNTYDNDRPTDIIMETYHVSTVEDIQVYLETIRRGRTVRGDANYRYLLEIRFNKYTVSNVLKNADFWNILRECVLTTYASRTYHISGVVFDYADFVEVEKVPSAPKHFDHDLMVPIFVRPTGYYHHKSVLYGPKSNSDNDYITQWNKLQPVLDKLGCTGLLVGDDLVQPSIPFDKKWVMYYKLLKKIRTCWHLVEKLQEWQYVAPIQNEDSSTENSGRDNTESDDAVSINVDGASTVVSSGDDDYEADPDEIINANGMTADEERVAQENETVTKERMPINITATVISMQRRREAEYNYIAKISGIDTATDGSTNTESTENTTIEE